MARGYGSRASARRDREVGMIGWLRVLFLESWVTSGGRITISGSAAPAFLASAGTCVLGRNAPKHKIHRTQAPSSGQTSPLLIGYSGRKVRAWAQQSVSRRKSLLFIRIQQIKTAQ